ncbi:hypothetical protein ACFSQP_07315 [Bizionia sediminis]|uniref:Uncharacterized protein n=1 Tax=Bizionia sediminis TaxID=1737064 RepID=A0ABW5KTQ0_9FLAO
MRYTIKRVDKDFFETNSDLKKKLNKISSKSTNLEPSNSVLNREIYNNEYGFTIETDYVKYIEDNITGYHSYSFPLIRDFLEDDRLENLVFQSNDQGTYNAYIVKYGFSKAEYEVLETERLDNLSTKYIAIVFDEVAFTPNNTQSLTIELACVELWTHVHTSNNEGNNMGGEPLFVWIWVLESQVCEWANTGDGPNGSSSGYTFLEGNTNGTGAYTPGGSSTGTASPQTPILSTPVVPLPWQQVVACINGVVISETSDDTFLNNLMITELQNSKSLATQANDYLNHNGCSEEAKAFVIEAIEAIDEGGLVDFENEIIKHPSFIGPKAESVLDELISEGNNLFKTVSEAFTNNDSEFRIVFMVADSPSNSPAHTPMPEDTGLIYIKTDPDYVNGNAIDLASIIMHETIHAELHRIFIADNQGPNPMPQNLFNWYLKLWNFYNNGNQNDTATAAEHNYMAAHYIDNIAQGIREFDQNAQSIEHYKGFSWEGLSSYGVAAGYISNQEFGEFLVLSSIVYSGNHINSCDE